MAPRQAKRKRGMAAWTGRKQSGARVSPRRKEAALSARERRWLRQLVACGGIFVVIVAAKLILPGRLDGLRSQLRAVLEQNMDVREVFSAVGQAAAGEKSVDKTLDEVYRAVFHPQEDGALQTASPAVVPEVSENAAMDSLRSFRTQQEAAARETEASAGNLAYVLYSDQNLPENVSMEQAILGFAYCAPVVGTISSGFGYREHPTEGEERFHYGLDLAADSGTAIACFADGTVKAVGESSSYGKYLIVSHEGGYDTLYAHCSSISVSSGTEVCRGQTIARVGDTGMATGPHLHFELHRDGVYLNPIYYVAAV